jgi:nucleotide-binding universal stress UspA family protein
LAGRPAEALQRLAVESGHDLLVVGTRGAGLSKLLLGSTATALAAHAKVPVLLAGGGRGRATHPRPTVMNAGAHRGMP